MDEDYRGEVGVLLFNHSDIDFKGDYFNNSLIINKDIFYLVNYGDRIA